MTARARILRALASGPVPALDLAARVYLSAGETYAATLALLASGEVVEVWPKGQPEGRRRCLALPSRKAAT